MGVNWAIAVWSAAEPLQKTAHQRNSAGDAFASCQTRESPIQRRQQQRHHDLQAHRTDPVGEATADEPPLSRRRHRDAHHASASASRNPISPSDTARRMPAPSHLNKSSTGPTQIARLRGSPDSFSMNSPIELIVSSTLFRERSARRSLLSRSRPCAVIGSSRGLVSSSLFAIGDAPSLNWTAATEEGPTDFQHPHRVRPCLTSRLVRDSNRTRFPMRADEAGASYRRNLAQPPLETGPQSPARTLRPVRKSPLIQPKIQRRKARSNKSKQAA